MGAHGIILAVLLFMLFGGSLKGELAKGLGYLWPTLPWLIPLVLIIYSGTAQSAVNTVADWVDRLFKSICAFLYGLGFIVFVIPVMVADTFLLGPLAMWAWKHTEIQILLIIASGFGYYYLNREPVTIPKTYLMTMIGVGVATIVLGYFSQFVFNTHWIQFSADNGPFYAEPAESVEVRGGDQVRFVGFGYGKGVVTFPPIPPATTPTTRAISVSPDGDSKIRALADPSDKRGKPVGQIEFLVEYPDGTERSVAIKNIQTGPKKIFGMDFNRLFAMGYYISAEAEIPKDFPVGRLGLQMFSVPTPKGEMRLTLLVNLGETLVGRFTRGFILGEGFKAFTKKDYLTGINVLGTLMLLSMLIFGARVAWHTKEGLRIHISEIVAGAIAFMIFWYMVTWFIDGTGGGRLKTAVNNILWFLW